MLLRLLSHDRDFLLRLRLGLPSSCMLPSPLLLDPPSLQHRSLKLISLVYRFRKMSTPAHADHGQHGRPSVMADCRQVHLASAHSPRNLPDFGIHFPSFLERIPVFHRCTFSRVDHPQFIRSLRLPDPHIPIVRPGQYEPRICRKCGRKYPKMKIPWTYAISVNDP